MHKLAGIAREIDTERNQQKLVIEWRNVQTDRLAVSRLERKETREI